MFDHFHFMNENDLFFKFSNDGFFDDMIGNFFNDDFFGNKNKLNWNFGFGFPIAKDFGFDLRNGSDFNQGFTLVSKSVSSQTIIKNGEKVKITTTTIQNPDGSIQKETVEERTDRNGTKTTNRVTNGNSDKHQIKYRN